MKRTDFLRSCVLAAGSLSLSSFRGSKTEEPAARKPVLKLAHITDVHIRPEADVPARYLKCIAEIRKHPLDFILNGGDSIHAADYNDITRERMQEQWQTWDECLKAWNGTKIYSCIGNHDSWWAAPEKTDPQYGKDYVVKRLGIPNRYYHFREKGWQFIILDGNNPKVTLDEEQYKWLEATLNETPANMPTLLMSHYPVLGTTPILVGGGHGDHKKLKDLFYQHRDKVKLVLSGHNHLLDRTEYNGVTYCCNGAMSGFWWDAGDEHSKGRGFYQETPPGYTLLNLYADGSFENTYIPHTYL